MAQDIKQQFTLRMFEIYRQAKEQAGYSASIFYGMISKNGGLATAKTFINAAKPSDGYTTLYERGFLNITVEAVVVEESRWQPLFTDEEIHRARKRLKDYGYTPQIR